MKVVESNDYILPVFLYKNIQTRIITQSNDKHYASIGFMILWIYNLYKFINNYFST